jgi:putative ABC transport system permease protein
MRVPLAWRKITLNKLRTLALLSGVCFSLFLMFLQLGFYDSSERSATMIFDHLDFDAALVAPNYTNVRVTGQIPRGRLAQARGVPGVRSVAPVYIGNEYVRNPDTGFRRELVLLGIDPVRPSLRLPEVARQVPLLKQDDTAIWDEKAQEGYGGFHPGLVAEVGRRRVRVVATYAHGAGFIAPAMMIVSDRTRARLVGGGLDDVSLGLVKLRPGADPGQVLAALRARLPADVVVWSRAELEGAEQHYFMRVKPLGILFASGVLLALAVGTVILYQILATEVAGNLKQYATLLALGYGDGYVNGLVIRQAVLLGLLGFGPAALLAQGVYALTRVSTNLPLYMTWGRLGLVLLLAVLMCSASGVLALRQVRRADPASLF